jgi:hypothetical protein
MILGNELFHHSNHGRKDTKRMSGARDAIRLRIGFRITGGAASVCALKRERKLPRLFYTLPPWLDHLTAAVGARNILLYAFRKVNIILQAGSGHGKLGLKNTGAIAASRAPAVDNAVRVGFVESFCDIPAMFAKGLHSPI